MSPCELERAVARATGESPREIRRRGFQPLTLTDDCRRDEGEMNLRVVDWDLLQVERPVLFPIV